jgi:hypothetical protein
MPTTSDRKIKKSFSITTDSDAFIRKMQKARKTRSESETLDLLLTELRTLQERHTLAAAYSSYYDSLGEEELKEQRSWGDFAEENLRDLEP